MEPDSWLAVVVDVAAVVLMMSQPVEARLGVLEEKTSTGEGSSTEATV